ncbi:MAG: hypothetical protein HZC41_18195 [Chloroflexi bacterium]|nr:hypothetical protein [Chloroflexota bacterium]
MDIETVLREKRDSKAKPHLEQYAPVWMVHEKVLPKDDAIIFNVVFQHPYYGWVNRRYRYDAFNDVLYYRGQVTLSEAEAVAVQEKEPYIEVTVADVPNSYGG